MDKKKLTYQHSQDAYQGRYTRDILVIVILISLISIVLASCTSGNKVVKSKGCYNPKWQVSTHKQHIL